MHAEIERKFLLKDSSWKKKARGTPFRQGYLCTATERTVRVRIAGAEAFLTVKGPSRGARRSEWEYPIPRQDAEEMLAVLCERPLIEKIRYRVRHGDLTWEIDEFLGENDGLVLAEVELPCEDARVELPPWAGAEVTGDPRYFNAYLSRTPYGKW